MSPRKREDDEIPAKVQRLYDALRSSEVENFSLQPGKLGDRTVFFVVAEGEDEEDDRPVAMLLDGDLIEELADAFGNSDEDEEDEDEESDSGRRYVP